MLPRRIIVFGMGLGSLAGLAYWYFVGCASGTCLITSNWYTSMGYGILMGGLAASIYQPKQSS